LNEWENSPNIWIDKDEVIKHPELQSYEYELCSRSFWYWVTRWFYTKDENYYISKRLFPSYPHLKRLSDLLKTQRILLIPKSRRMQMTWFSIAYGVWLAQFHEDKLVMIQSLKAEKAEVLIEKAEFSIKLEPDFLFPSGRPRLMKASIVFTNGSKIWGIPQGDTQLAGETVSLWISDEAALHNLLENALIGSLPTLMGGGRALILSSIRPSYFADLVDDVKVGEITDEWITEEKVTTSVIKGVTEWQNKNNVFYVVRIHYSADPNKDPDTPAGRAWRDEERKKYTDKVWAQEYEIDATALAESLIYNIVPATHIVNYTIQEILAMDGTIYHTLDPGIDDPTAGLWAKALPTGDVIFFAEYCVRNKAIHEHCFALDDFETKYGFKPFVSRIDPSACKRMHTGTTVMREYATDILPRFYSPANNDLEAGIEVVKTYLTNAIMGRSPACYFLPSLGNLFREARRYVIGNNDKPKDKNNHLMDCMRYMLMMFPSYINQQNAILYNVVRDNLTGYVEYERITSEEDLQNGYFRVPD
jgi:hypothetical protein